MTQRRMISLKIADTDVFLEMPVSSRLLYFDLLLRADDDGFVSSPKKIARMTGASEDDLKVLAAKKFIIQFESGVCVIKHWLIHNLIRADRYSETQYIKEKEQLMIDSQTKKYSLAKRETPKWQPNGNQMAPQVRLGKVSIGKDRSGKDSIEERVIEQSSPSQIMKGFINNFYEKNEDYQSLIGHLVEKGANKSSAEIEIAKFVSYWTELNKSGTKQRWETEKTFEVQRRLGNWFSKIREFNKTNERKGIEI